MKDGSRCHCSLKLLNLEAWWQGLLQLVCLLLIVDHQSVEEPGAPNLELNVVGVLLDLDAAGVLPPGLQEEVLENKGKYITLSMKISDRQHFESSGGHYFLDHFN